eukprot:scaffold218582_cov31-Tisochrysis_lutea.AAC.3
MAVGTSAIRIAASGGTHGRVCRGSLARCLGPECLVEPERYLIQKAEPKTLKGIDFVLREWRCEADTAPLGGSLQHTQRNLRHVGQGADGEFTTSSETKRRASQWGADTSGKQAPTVTTTASATSTSLDSKQTARMPEPSHRSCACSRRLRERAGEPRPATTSGGRERMLL